MLDREWGLQFPYSREVGKGLGFHAGAYQQYLFYIALLPLIICNPLQVASPALL